MTYTASDETLERIEQIRERMRANPTMAVRPVMMGAMATPEATLAAAVEVGLQALEGFAAGRGEITGPRVTIGDAGRE